MEPPATTLERRPWRLGDLDRRGRWFAVLLVVLLAIPFVASVARYVGDDWIPSGDNALIALRARDVFSAHPPLLGQPSNAGNYAKDNPVHPGPIEFYLLSAPVHLLGAAMGQLLGAAAFGFAGVLGGLWAVFRRTGPRVAVVAAALIAFLAWVAGPAALVNPISSNIGGIPLLALALMAWAVLDGDVRLLPLAAFAFSFVAQQHLAILGLGVGLGAWLVLAAVLAHVRWVRARRAEAEGAPPSTRGPDERPYPWIIAAAVVVLVCWAPVILDTIIHFPGNGWDIILYSRSNDHPSQGLTAGVRQVLRAVGLPPFLLRTNVTGTDMLEPLPAFTAVTGVLMLLLVGAVAVAFRRTKVVLSRLAATTLWLALLSLVVGSKMPASIEAVRFSFYRWSIVLAIMTALTLLWAVWDLLTPRLAAHRETVVNVVMTVSVCIVAVVSVLAAAASGPRRQLDSTYLNVNRAFVDDVNREVDRGESVGLVVDGGGSYLMVGPAVALSLAENGHHVVAASQDPRFYSNERVPKSGEKVDRVFVIRDGKTLDREMGGKVLERFEPPGTELATKLADQVRGQPVVPSAKGKAMVERDGPKGQLTAAGFSVMATDPLVPLMNAASLQYLIDGYLESPTLDRDQLIELQRQVRTTMIPDSYELREMAPQEAATYYPNAFAADGSFR